MDLGGRCPWWLMPAEPPTLCVLGEAPALLGPWLLQSKLRGWGSVLFEPPGLHELTSTFHGSLSIPERQTADCRPVSSC